MYVSTRDPLVMVSRWDLEAIGRESGPSSGEDVDDSVRVVFLR